MASKISWILFWGLWLVDAGIKAIHANKVWSIFGWVFLFFVIASIIGVIFEKLIKEAKNL